MRRKTHRLIAMTCVLCMLFTSMPASVYSDPVPATPTDLLPVETDEITGVEEATAAEEPAEEQTEEQAEEPTEEQTEEQSEAPAEVPAEAPTEETETAATETAAEAPADQPADEAPEEAGGEEEPERMKADRDLKIGEKLTITGELQSGGNGEYLVRFKPAKDQTMYLILTADRELKTTVTDEDTGAETALALDHTDEDGTVTLIAADYRARHEGSYLVRITGKTPATFTLLMVKKSIYDQEHAEAEEPAEEPEEEPTEEKTEETTEELTQEPTEEPAEEQTEDQDGEPAEASAEAETEEPAEEPAEAPEEEPAEEPAEEQNEDQDREPAEKPAEAETEEPAEEPAEAAEEESTEDLAEESETEPAADAPEEEADEPEEKAEESAEDPDETQEDSAPTEPEADEETELPATPTDLEPEEPVEIRIDATASDLNAYIIFLSNAGIPQDAELQVRELTDEEQAAYQAETAQALNAEDESYLRYTKYLAFSLTSNGEAIELNAPVTVSVTLPDVSEGADALQVVRFDDRKPVLLDSERNENTISYETDTFGVFGIGNALVAVTNHETELAKVEVLSFSEDAPVSVTVAADPEVIEGLEVLGTFTIEDNTAAATGTEEQEGLFIKAELKDDAELDPMEGVALYSVDENGQTDILMEELTGEAKITELEATQVAVIKDTGYRHLTLTVNPDETTDDQTVTLDGMMPKDAEAAIEDVTAAHASENDMELSEENYTSEAANNTAETAAYDNIRLNGSAAIAEAEKAERTPEETPDEETDGATGEAVDKSTAEAEEETNEGSRPKLIAAYDITILNGTEVYQPDEEKPITVEIIDSRITADKNIELWHIRDDGSEEQIESFVLEDGKIRFDATGFSVYTIVEAGDPPSIETTVLTDISQLKENEGYVFSSTRDKSGIKNYNYMTSKYSTTATRLSHFSGVTDISRAQTWYLEAVAGKENTYYIYCRDSTGERQNLEMKSDSNYQDYFGLTTATGSEFLFRNTWNNEGTFYINTYKGTGTTEYAFSISGANTFFLNKGRPYGQNTGDMEFERMKITKAAEVPYNYYELNGKTYGIVYHEESIKGAGLLSRARGVTGLQAQDLLVRPDVLDHENELLIAKGTEISEWTFECVNANKYYITTEEGGTKKYLTLNGGVLTLSTTQTEKSVFSVEAGTGIYKGKYRFSVGNYSLGVKDGAATNGFSGINDSKQEQYTWLNLAVTSEELTDADFVVYSAEKVNLSDREQVPDGAQVVVFTREWNEDKKQYEFYLIDYDGSLIRCYESGDMIQWIGSGINTSEWKFTEYLGEDNQPNFYYELQNSYSGACIVPQVGADSPLKTVRDYPNPFDRSMNLNGRRYGYYYSTIVAWDEDNYSYAALKTDLTTGKVTSCPLNDGEVFYFAVMKPYVEEVTELTKVDTIEHTQYGITMKIIDLNNTNSISGQMNAFLGSNSGGAVQTTVPNLLSTDLGDDDYPTAAGGSLGDLYSGATEVNHLFIANTYYSSGYYEFDSTQNFATLIKEDGTPGSTFTVYEQLGTYDSSDKNSLKHGQFFPFNTIVPGEYAITNGVNLCNALTDTLPDSDPRKYEQLYDIEHGDDTVNPYFAVELEASFTQTVDGHDAWDHDIIYEFTGDDDFWLYVDGELIIDLGGIHSALAGKVNYSTGEVEVNKVPTTLYEIFKKHYEDRGLTAAQVAEKLDEKFEEKTRNGKTYKVFKDYSTHTMRIFYMERGAGASNIHMRFNLASVRPGTILLNKEITGVEDTSSFMAEYPYQIWYKDGQDHEILLDPSNDPGIKVVFKDTENVEVPYKRTFTAADGTTYQSVYLLRPDQIAEIQMPDYAIEYRIVECCVDTDIYDPVKANGEALSGTTIPGKTDDYPRKDFSLGYAATKNRTRVTFDNHVKEGVLRTIYITKRMYKEDGITELDHGEIPEVFAFRLYLGTENDSLEDLPLANMQRYYVKDDYGNFCRWNSSTKKLESLGETVFANLTPEQKKQATFNTSMNGAISNIQVQYTVVVPDILAGTKYMVEERKGEIPDGFSLQKYVMKEDIGDETADDYYTPTPFVTEENEDPHVEVRNMKGWGLRMTKAWSDESFMDARDTAYFALYVNDNGTFRRYEDIYQEKYQNATTIPSTLMKLEKGETSLYWYLPQLLPGFADFDLYEVREVEITVNGTLTEDEDGALTGDYTITQVCENSTNVFGHQKGNEDAGQIYPYKVTYQKGQLTTGSNVRQDTIRNSRKGVTLYKTTMDGIPLPGAVFTLTAGDGTPAGAATYTSDENGLITVAYLRDGENYTLTEISAPAGYQAASYHATQEPLVLHLDYSGATPVLTVTGGDLDGSNTYGYYTFTNTPSDPDEYGTVTIRNKEYTLQIKKTDNYGNPISGVHFALYRQVKGSNGVMRKDYRPIAGYSSLESGSDGLLPLITDAFKNGSLGAGVYYLTETEAVDGYQPLSSDVIFEVTETGAVRLCNAAETGAVLTPENPDDEGEKVEYLIAIPNSIAVMKHIVVKKEVLNGTSADTNGVNTFDFTARLYMPNGQTTWRFTDTEQGFSNGKKTFSLSNADGANKVTLTVPAGAVLRIYEDPNDLYTTEVQWNDETAESRTEWKEAISEDGTVTFINTRKWQDVIIKKSLSDPLTGNGTFHFTAVLTDGEVDVTGDVGELNSFTIPVTNRTGQKTFSLPVGTVLTVTETDEYVQYTTKAKWEGGNTVDGAVWSGTIPENGGPLTFTNTRRKMTVKVSKELVDADATAAVSFSFTATLLNGTSPVSGYELAKNIKTNATGSVTFTISATHGEPAAEKTLSVPYGTTLTITENDSTYTTTVNGASGKTGQAENVTTNEEVLAFVNTNAEATEIPIAPTNYRNGKNPYIFLLAFGILLLFTGGISIKKRKRAEEKQFNSGPGTRGARQGPGARGDPRGIPRGGGNPPCPRLNLWIQPNGSPGKRGDPGG